METTVWENVIVAIQAKKEDVANTIHPHYIFILSQCHFFWLLMYTVAASMFDSGSTFLYKSSLIFFFLLPLDFKKIRHSFY